MIDKSRLQTIIDVVLDSNPKTKFNLSALFIGDKIKFAQTDVLVEPTKEFKGILTDFVVGEFFPTHVETELFIKMVYGSFNEAINIYCKAKGFHDLDIFFVYKGGNILRYIAYQAMHELGSIVSDTINKYYKDVFKKSDADFSIYIKPTLPDYDEIFIDMNNLAFLVQNELRNEFLLNSSKYFRYYELSNVKKKEILTDYLTKLNNSDTVKTKKFDFDGAFSKLIFEDVSTATDNTTYVPKSDYYIDYDINPDFYIDREPIPTYMINLKPLYLAQIPIPKLNKLATEQEKIYTNRQYHSIMVSSNQTLDFWKEKNHVKFSLVRTKIIFDVYFNHVGKPAPVLMKLDGELIDVSISHKDDSGIKHYFIEPAKNVDTYHIKSDSEDFAFRAPSLQYLIEDIEIILYVNQLFPWDNIKYAKRIKRLLFLYFMVLLIDLKMPYEKKIEYMRNIQNIIRTPNKIDSFLQTHSEQNPFWKLLENYKLMISRNNDKHDLDMEKLQEYTKLIFDNIDILAGLFPIIMNQCHVQGLNPNRITEGSVLYGGYHTKYLKYKRKYLKLKSNSNNS